MKRHISILVTGVLLVLFLVTGSAQAATNIGRGNIGADPTNPDTDYVTDSAVLTITSATLSVVKVAFLDDDTGTQIAGGSSVVKGTIVKYMIYVDNSTATSALDIRLQDMLNEVDFTYQANSLSWNNNVTNTAAVLATIFGDTDTSGANTGVALTDAISGADVASADITQTPDDRITMGAHTAQTNAQLNVPAGKIAAFMLRARIN
jgi:hypothetical protein